MQESSAYLKYRIQIVFCFKSQLIMRSNKSDPQTKFHFQQLFHYLLNAKQFIMSHLYSMKKFMIHQQSVDLINKVQAVQYQTQNQTINIKMTQSSASPAQQPAKLESPKQQKPQSLNDKKRKLEHIWRGIFLFITIGSSIFFQRIYQYQTREQFVAIRKGSFTKLSIVGIPFAVFFILADAFSHKLFDSVCAKYYISHTKYPTEEERKKRCYTLVKWGFSIFYYGITSIFAYFILLDTSYMPSWLGGSGDCTDCIRYVESFDEATWAMEIYYGVQFGKHLGRFFQHVFIRPEGNFYEYTLHHALSTFLIFFSYMMNFWMIGIFLLMIHDASDFFLIIPRAYRDYKNIYKPFLQLQYVVMAVTWISCRIFMLSYCAVFTAVKNLYYVAYHPEIFEPFFMQVMYLPSVLMAIMIVALEVLQIFWTYHIITSFIEVNVSSKIAKHTYD